MPLIQIHMLEGRPPAKKEELIEKVSKLVAEILDSPLDAVRVLIQEMPLENWGVAGESMRRRRSGSS
jgi:4-oxalocrotonate tautomerase